MYAGSWLTSRGGETGNSEQFRKALEFLDANQARPGLRGLKIGSTEDQRYPGAIKVDFGNARSVDPSQMGCNWNKSWVKIMLRR